MCEIISHTIKFFEISRAGEKKYSNAIELGFYIMDIIYDKDKINKNYLCGVFFLKKKSTLEGWIFLEIGAC